MTFSEDDVQQPSGRVSNDNKTRLVICVFSIFNFDCVWIIEDLSCFAETNAMLREILNSFLVIPLESQIKFLPSFYTRTFPTATDSFRLQIISPHRVAHTATNPLPAAG